MPKPKGTLIKWLAECGHWMECYALEPTPDECPDCAVNPEIRLAGGDVVLPTLKRLKPVREAS